MLINLQTLHWTLFLSLIEKVVVLNLNERLLISRIISISRTCVFCVQESRDEEKELWDKIVKRVKKFLN